ncbi:MAG: 30S ribosomal protein S3 [Candidatus Kerfeldbacteria bacterium]|nr:30S ribosomal protein S3 [Candidatus Kerfeldbacteria bacterium]
MGHKVNPKVFRIGTTQVSPSRWFSARQYAEFLREDIQIRSFLREKLKEGGVARIETKRTPDGVNVVIYTSRPGVVIGRGGAGIEDLKNSLIKLLKGKRKVTVAIQEVNQPNLNAQIIVLQIAEQLEKRVPFRTALRRSLEQIEQAGAKGVKLQVSGRLNGSEIARTETSTKGSVPLHTLRADIDYARGAAHTIYGTVGIKAWIYKGDIFHNVALEESPVKATK